jgi:hypothetical protein
MIEKLFSKILEIFGSADSTSARKSNGAPVGNTARTWQEAAETDSTGRKMYDALTKELSGPVGHRVTRLLLQSCKSSPLTSSLPTNVIKYIQSESIKGRRPEFISKDLHSMLPQMTKKQLESISRTVVRKTWTALDRARAEDLGLDWVADNSNDELFDKWLNLRDDLKNNRRIRIGSR